MNAISAQAMIIVRVIRLVILILRIASIAHLIAQAVDMNHLISNIFVLIVRLDLS